MFQFYKLIRRSPGINAARIQQRSGLSFGTASWPIKMLGKFKIVRIETINDSITCFDASIDKKLDSTRSLTRLTRDGGSRDESALFIASAHVPLVEQAIRR
jgi:predicted transcriptional regulator